MNDGHPFRVYLNDPISDSALRRLRAHVELTDTFEQPETLDAIILRQQYCTREVIRRAKNCKLIQQHGVGLDRIDVQAAKEYGIPVKNTPGTNARSVAEYAIAMLLDLSRKVTAIHEKTRQGKLPDFGMPETVGLEMSGKTLGLVGSGHIAREVAQIARDGFRMTVACYNPHKSARQLAAMGFAPVADLRELFRTCDYVSLHCLLTEDTYHMIGADVLAECRPGLILVNTARGGLIDEAALYDALVSRRVAAAGLDVFERQPPAVENPLLSLENFLAGMHVAGSTYEAMERMGKAVVDSVFDALGIEG